MPVATLVIVPTSRGVSCGVKASRAWLMPVNAWSKMLCRGSQAVRMLIGLASAWFGLGLAQLRFRLAFSFRSSPTPFSSDVR